MPVHTCCGFSYLRKLKLDNYSVYSRDMAAGCRSRRFPDTTPRNCLSDLRSGTAARLRRHLHQLDQPCGKPKKARLRLTSIGFSACDIKRVHLRALPLINYGEEYDVWKRAPAREGRRCNVRPAWNFPTAAGRRTLNASMRWTIAGLRFRLRECSHGTAVTGERLHRWLSTSSNCPIHPRADSRRNASRKRRRVSVWMAWPINAFKSDNKPGLKRLNWVVTRRRLCGPQLPR